MSSPDLKKSSVSVEDETPFESLPELDHDAKEGSVDLRVLSSNDDLLDASEPEAFKWSNWFFRRKQVTMNEDSIATRRSVYDDPSMAIHYWPKDDYENIHRFDPKARWTHREEKVCAYQTQYRLSS